MALSFILLAGPVSAAGPLSDRDAWRAGITYEKAVVCQADKRALARFKNRMERLTEEPGRDPDAPVSRTRAAFLNGMVCDHVLRQGVEHRSDCAPEPVMSVDCATFLRGFRRMRILGADWRPSDGIR